MSGDVLRRTGGVTLTWGDASHFAAGRHLPCRICSTVTQMRDDRGEPCHLECAEQELARVITTERFGDAGELAQELTGFPRPAVAGPRVPLAPEVRR